MPRLFDQIREAVASDRYVIGIHADERLRERRIRSWQVIAGLAEGRVLIERPHDKPNPVIEVEQLLPDGTAVKAVWAWLGPDRAAKLVTVHFFNR